MPGLEGDAVLTENVPHGAQTASDSATRPVRYLLALNAGATEAPDGRLYADPSWCHDLIEHAVHFPQMTFLAPVDRHQPLATEALIPDVFHKVVRYRGFGGRFLSYLRIPLFIGVFARELRRADIVHTCIAGMPYPIGWLVVPLAKLLRVKVAIVVESAFWRLNPGEHAGLGRRMSAITWEAINRWCLRQADYAAYQHESDRRALPAPHARRSVLYQASWVNEADILPQEEIERRLHRRPKEQRLNVLFASRMVVEKGTGTVAALFSALAADRVDITVLGAGPERAAVMTAAEQHSKDGRFRGAEPIPYGPAFLEFLDGFDVVIVPSLSDEQPRIVYDAYARGVAVVASRTSGLEACVNDGETGILVPPGDVVSLANALRMLSRDIALVRSLSLGGLARAATCTHRAFHAARAADIKAVVHGDGRNGMLRVDPIAG
jgi:glycosyltransferase involved in cell wall biosynthesis